MPQNLPPTTACTVLFAVQANSWECFYYFNTNCHRHTGRGGGSFQQFSQKYLPVHFFFTNISNILFSFVTCSMHKNPHQNAGNGIKEIQLFKIFLRSMPPDHHRGFHASGTSQANLCLLPKGAYGKKKQPPKYSVFKNPMKFKKLQIAQGTKNHIYKTISFSWEHM